MPRGRKSDKAFAPPTANREPVAWTVLQVVRRLSRKELNTWAESLSICASTTAAQMSPDELAARIVLFFTETEKDGPRLINVPTKEQLLWLLHPPPKSFGDLRDLLEHSRRRVLIDGEELWMPELPPYARFRRAVGALLRSERSERP